MSRTGSTSARGNRSRQAAETASEYASESYGTMQRCITDYPGAAIGMAFGAGLALGLVLTAGLGESSSASRGWLDRRTAEDIGRRILDSMTSVLPNSLTQHLSK